MPKYFFHIRSCDAFMSADIVTATGRSPGVCRPTSAMPSPSFFLT
jgi:hypothetical protein